MKNANAVWYQIRIFYAKCEVLQTNPFVKNFPGKHKEHINIFLNAHAARKQKGDFSSLRP